LFFSEIASIFSSKISSVYWDSQRVYSIPKDVQLTGFQLVEDLKTTVMAQFAHHPLAIHFSRERENPNTFLWCIE